MKIAIGGLAHETNTFNVRRTELDSFKTGFGVVASHEIILSHFRDTGTVLGGFIAAGSELNFDVLPTFYAQAAPDTGLVSQEAFTYLENELLTALLSALHGWNSASPSWRYGYGEIR